MDITRTFFLSAVLSLALIAHALPALGADAPATRPPELDALIAKLGSDDFRVRDAAQALIVEMGDAAVKPMEELAEKSPDAEVRQRASDILKQIGAKSLTKPTLVTLKFKDAPAQDVYKSLYEQANARLAVWPPTLFDAVQRGGAELPKVTIDVNKVPFWEAFVELAEQTGLTVDDIGGEMRLTEQRRRGGKLGARDNVCITGPFMVVVDDTFGGGAMIHELKVFVEPRIRVLGHAGEPDIAEVADANGQPIAEPAVPRPRMRHGREMMDRHGGNAFDVRFDQPLMMAGQVRGSVRAEIMTKQQTADIDNVAKANNVEKQAGGRRFLLNAMNPEKGEWFITLVVYNTNPPTPNLTDTKVSVMDAKGNPLSGGFGLSGSDKWVAIDLKLNEVPNGGPPDKIRITVPTETTEIDIPFQFKREGAARGKRQAG